MALDMNSYMVFLLISCRMAGVIFFNPILGRRNIPNMVKVGLSLGISLMAAYQLQDASVMDYTSLELMVSLVKEFAVGYAMGFVIQLFFAVAHVGGELIDLQMGLSMAQQYDPTTNSQISITGNLITAMYTMLFFITNSHINLMAVAVSSYQVIPLGMGPISSKIGVYFIELFGYMFVYALQLALPIIIMEMILEVAVGMLMRVVPNINVFVVNLQLKLMVGMIVLVTIMPMLTRFMTKLMGIMMQRVQDVLIFFV